MKSIRVFGAALFYFFVNGSEAFPNFNVSDYILNPYSFGNSCSRSTPLNPWWFGWSEVYSQLDRVIGSYGILNMDSKSFIKKGNLFGPLGLVVNPLPKIKLVFSENYPEGQRKILKYYRGNPSTVAALLAAHEGNSQSAPDQVYTNSYKESTYSIRTHYRREIANLDAFISALEKSLLNERPMIEYFRENGYALIIGYEGVMGKHEIQSLDTSTNSRHCSSWAGRGDQWEVASLKYYFP